MVFVVVFWNNATQGDLVVENCRANAGLRPKPTVAAVVLGNPHVMKEEAVQVPPDAEVPDIIVRNCCFPLPDAAVAHIRP